MNSFKKIIKRHTKQIGVAIVTGFLWAQPSFADANTNILTHIYYTTYQIYQQVASQLPAFISAYFKDLIVMAQAVTSKEDPNQYISNSQPIFGTIFNSYMNTANKQYAMSQQLTQEFLTGNGNHPLPAQANELNYSILIGGTIKPFHVGDLLIDTNTLGRNYLKHVAGTGFALAPPNPKWGTKGDAGKQYTALYNTSAAIASYDAYILSGLSDQKEQDNNRAYLSQLASNDKWFVDIQAEDIGLVFRQILMYISQIYVTLDRSLKVQQQQIAATAMTNTLLLILVNSITGQTLATQAANQ